MNLPNKLTTFRMLMVIPFLVISILFISYDGGYSFNNINKKTVFFIIALVIFVIAMITDWLDGHIARKRKIVTTYGKLFDPLADKLITSTAFIILTCAQIVPIWVTIPMILRDVVVDGCRNLLAKNNATVAASFAGKAKTMLQSLGIVFIFIMVPALELKPGLLQDLTTGIACINIPLYGALALSLYSGFNYVKSVKQYINVK